MATTTPTWDPPNLRRHHQKRTTEDAGCFEDLLGIKGKKMTESEFEKRSLAAVANAWAEYRATRIDRRRGIPILKVCAYAADDDLVFTVLNPSKTRFISCYHKHFRGPHGFDPSATDSVAYKRMRFRWWVQNQEWWGKIHEVRRLRGL